MARGHQIECAVCGDHWLHSTDHDRETGTRLNDVELRRNLNRPFELLGAPAERVGQLEEDAANLFCLLLFERDDLVIDLNGLERLDEQARATRRSAMDDARYRRAVFGANHQHVAAVAIGDHLFLQILRVPSAEKAVQRCPQSLLVLTQTVADRGQRGTGVVGHFARWLDLAANIGNLLRERRNRLDQQPQQRKRGANLDDRLTRLLDRFEVATESQQPHRLEPSSLHAERRDDLVEIGRRA
jgi:hypothetical protein